MRQTTQFMKWYAQWYKGVADKMNITLSLPNVTTPFSQKDVVILDLFEKIDQSIDAKPYLIEILRKADEYGVTIYLEPMPRYKYFRKDLQKRIKISKDYLIDYYNRFGFELTEDKRFMKRKPKEDTPKTFSKGGLIAPNGKPSNLTAEQYKLVRTKAFKDWFGDWENDPEKASKVVDENGEPLVVYHGTNNDFNIFDKNRGIYRGFYFTAYKNYQYIVKYTKKILACFLSIKNPPVIEPLRMGLGRQYVVWNDVFLALSFLDIQKDEFDKIKSLGFDGLIGNIKDGDYELPNAELVVFEPNQIKLADGTNTTFDGSNPDIRYDDGGKFIDYIDELYQTAIEKFESNGYEITQGANSNTDYGHSRYFYVNQNNEAKVNSGLGFQVRVSDHSTGDKRILNGEQFIFSVNDIDEVFHRINYWFHPDEYKNVVTVKSKIVNIEVGENDLRPSDTIISERVAKSGNKRYTIKRTYKNEGVMPTHITSGHQLSFKPNNPDIRYNNGGTMKKVDKGGITYGKSHDEGGIPVKNASTGQMLEVEGGEGIVNKRSMASDKKVKMNGKEMTICEAVSQLNQMEGGVRFSCDDVEHRQFIEQMALGGELERGKRTEREHIDTLRKLYEKRLTPAQAVTAIAKEHIAENPNYYSDLKKMDKQQKRERIAEMKRNFVQKAKQGAQLDEAPTPNYPKVYKFNDFFNTMQAYQDNYKKAVAAHEKTLAQGIKVKNDNSLPKKQKDAELEILRTELIANKDKLKETRKDLSELPNMESPFYAPKLAEGGQIVNGSILYNAKVGDIGTITIKPVKDDVELYKFPKTGFTIDWVRQDDGFKFGAFIGKRSIGMMPVLMVSKNNFETNVLRVNKFLTIISHKSNYEFQFFGTEEDPINAIMVFLNFLRFHGNTTKFLENYNSQTKSVYSGTGVTQGTTTTTTDASQMTAIQALNDACEKLQNDCFYMAVSLVGEKSTKVDTIREYFTNVSSSTKILLGDICREIKNFEQKNPDFNEWDWHLKEACFLAAVAIKKLDSAYRVLYDVTPLGDIQKQLRDVATKQIDSTINNIMPFFEKELNSINLNKTRFFLIERDYFNNLPTLSKMMLLLYLVKK